jgi:hypothetical protein
MAARQNATASQASGRACISATCRWLLAPPGPIALSISQQIYRETGATSFAPASLASSPRVRNEPVARPPRPSRTGIGRRAHSSIGPSGGEGDHVRYPVGRTTERSALFRFGAGPDWGHNQTRPARRKKGVASAWSGRGIRLCRSRCPLFPSALAGPLKTSGAARRSESRILTGQAVVRSRRWRRPIGRNPSPAPNFQ